MNDKKVKGHLINTLEDLAAKRQESELRKELQVNNFTNIKKLDK